jgi:probable F420-dependent oxidoreductase
VTVKVGMRIPHSLFEQDARALRAAVARAEPSGIDHLVVGDHVSFHRGRGYDGLLHAAALASLTETLTIETGVYLLGLRHPVPVARQVTSVAQLAPGRFVFGVGLGGEDRHELEVCGVDPTTRGRRLDESLTIVRALLAGDTVDFSGRIFQLEQATILPTPTKPVPIVIGGRSDAAFRRTARFGDGWLGLFLSPERYREAVAKVEQLATDAGRDTVDWNHGLHLWCGVGPGSDLLAESMESLYQLPFERFARYAPFGTPDEIAAYVGPYVDAGMRHLNLGPVAATPDEAIDFTAAVAQLLRAR